MSKLYALDPSHGNYVQKYLARELLEAPKELINQYVFFANTEPDEERIVLVNLALYLESLTRKCLLNRNIPNCKKYRVETLSQAAHAQLFIEEPSKDGDGSEINFIKFSEDWAE